MSGLLNDVRLAVRALWRHPGLTLAAALCLMLGIGATATVYASARALAFQPLPELHDAARLLLVREAPRGLVDDDGYTRVSAPVAAELGTLRAGGRPVFADVAATAPLTASVAGAGAGTGRDGGDAAVAERVAGVRASAEFWRTTGVAPALGRGFDAAEARGGAPVAVLGHGVWTRRFGADPGIVGRSILVDGEPHTVLGVMPADFRFPSGAQLWLPLTLDPAAATNREVRRLVALARLAPGVSAAEATRALAAHGERLARAHPATSGDWLLVGETAERFFARGPRPFLLASLAAVGFVLLIACANVANLLLARATARRREIALRAALGAGRGRIVRQLLVESLLLALVGGGAGTGLAAWGIQATRANIPAEVRALMAGYAGLRLDAHVLAVTLGLSMLTALVFGLAPALGAARLAVHDTLRAGSAGSGGRGGARGGRRMRRALVAAQVALALVLLVGATLTARTVAALAERDPGFETARLLTLRVSLPAVGAAGAPGAADSAARVERDRTARFYERLAAEAAALPGVRGAGAVSVLPLGFDEMRTPVVVAERAATTPAAVRPRVAWRRVTTGYFDALGIAVRRGRGFEAGDDADAPAVAVVSAAAARRFWGAADPVGRRLAVGDSGRAVEVVGVVADVRHNVLASREPTVAVYVPLAQAPLRGMALVVRTEADPPEALAPAVARTVAALDRSAAVGDVFGMQQVAATSAAPQRYTARLFALLAAAALLLAAVGTYGVMAHAVAERTRELGIRAALGATPERMLHLLAGDAARIAGVGVALGLVGAVGLAQGLRAILWGTPAFAPGTFLALALTLGAVAVVAGLLPARRAMHTEPMVVLREE